MSGSELIIRLHAIHDMEPKYNDFGFTPFTREAVEAIQETAGEAEILLHRLAFRCCDMCGVCPKERQDPFNCEIIDAVFDTAPAADVVEVRHGRWIYARTRGSFPACKCSVCGNVENADWAVLGDNVNYCPSCGAKMDGGPEDG